MVDEARNVKPAGIFAIPVEPGRGSIRDYYGTRSCMVMHRYAIGATGAPLFRMFNNRIQAKQVSHNAGVGGSSPPVATTNPLITKAFFAE
jgi:hypothetical protein